jgi:hypothetical protein
MTNFNDFLADQMKDERFRKEWKALELEFDIIQTIIDARNAEDLTLKELSEIARSDISNI